MLNCLSSTESPGGLRAAATHGEYTACFMNLDINMAFVLQEFLSCKYLFDLYCFLFSSFLCRTLHLAVLARRNLRCDSQDVIYQHVQTVCLVNPVIPVMMKSSPLPCLLQHLSVLLLFQMAAKISQLGVYMQSVLTNGAAGGASVQPQSQAAGLANQEQRGAAPAVGSSTAGAAPLQGSPCSGSQANANNVPAGLEKAAPASPTAQTSGQSKALPTHQNLV